MLHLLQVSGDLVHQASGRTAGEGLQAKQYNTHVTVLQQDTQHAVQNQCQASILQPPIEEAHRTLPRVACCQPQDSVALLAPFASIDAEQPDATLRMTR